jgi:hypothetical protein
MKIYRVYFIRDGIKKTKLVDAESPYEAKKMKCFIGVHFVLIREVDMAPE